MHKKNKRMPFPKINNILHLQKKEETEKRAVPKTETLNWFYATLSLWSFYYKPMDIYVWEHRFSQSPDQPCLLYTSDAADDC